jgi:hypothetical protein
MENKIVKNLTPELIEKAKIVKSAEELWEFAKANNVELTETEAKTYFAQLNASGALSDDELEAVSGGGNICGFFERFFGLNNMLNDNDKPEKPTLDNGIMPRPCDSLPCDQTEKKRFDSF